MKNILRFLSICFVFVAVFTGNMDRIKVYSEADRLTVDIGESFGSTSNNVYVPIDLSGLPSSGISAFNFVIEFDDNLIFNDVKPGNLIRTASDFSYYAKDNKIHILFSDSTAGVNPIKDGGTLCYLNFKIFNLNNNNEFKIKRAISSNEIFVNNNLNKVDVNFLDGKIIGKDKLYGVSKNRVWRITFNQEIDSYSLRNNSIEVRDINGTKVTSSFTLTDGGKTLEIFPPDRGYEVYKSYTITIKNSFLSKMGRKLSKEQAINFYIEN
jgi:hypothetical protein